jgi:hypothetical protein
MAIEWYPLAVRMIREGFERRRLTYSDAVEAIQEVGRMIGEDADLKTAWRTE